MLLEKEQGGLNLRLRKAGEFRENPRAEKAESEQGCCCVFQFAGHISSDDCEWIKKTRVQENQ
jgi:hypothetical protein